MNRVFRLAALLGAPDPVRPASASLLRASPASGHLGSEPEAVCLEDPADTTRETADEAYFRMLCMAFLTMAG
jgi:hypothetical protein